MTSSTTQAPHRRVRKRRRLRLTVALIVVALVGWLVKVGYDAIFGEHVVADSCQVVGLTTGNVYSMDPEQLLNASIIADVALRRNLPQRAVLVALATAYQESKLRNLDYGDADSLGLFQQRTSQGWGTAAQIMTPTYAAGKFYDALLKVPHWQSLPVSQAAQAVQRSAFPDAYSKWESPATALSAALTGSTSGQLTCQLGHPGLPSHSSKDAPAVVDAAATAVVRGLGSDLEITAPAVAADGSRGRTVTVSGLSAPSSGNDTSAEHRTATVAAWGVAHAKSQGITRIVAGDQEWRADRKGWHSTEHPAPDGAVVLTLSAR